MSGVLKIRGGTTAQHATFTGQEREITVDTTKDTLVVHDGTTAGGFPLAKRDELTATNTSYDNTTSGLAATQVQAAIDEVVATKQATLVSGTNIKTINGNSVLGSGNVNINAETLALFNASGSAPVYACRAWVNFNGTGTVAIRASGNVSSITDNGIGDYTVNFTTAMSDGNYAGSGFGGISAGALRTVSPVMKTASSMRIFCGTSGGSATDLDFIDIAIFR